MVCTITKQSNTVSKQALLFLSLVTLERGKYMSKLDFDINVRYNIDKETPVSARGRHVRADWSNIGEGYCGFFDPNDPEDTNLLRFDIYYREDEETEDWETVDGASYCTLMPADAGKEELTKSIMNILLLFSEIIEQEPDQHISENLFGTFPQISKDLFGTFPQISIRELAQKLSWVRPGYFN